MVKRTNSIVSNARRRTAGAVGLISLSIAECITDVMPFFFCQIDSQSKIIFIAHLIFFVPGSIMDAMNFK